MTAFDVVVVGSGAAGMTAAITAAASGLSVLVIEKTALFGGTTALSGGAAWIPNNHHMESAGVADSPQAALAYTKGILGNRYDPEMIGAFLENAPRMLAFLEANTSAVRFMSYMGPDYHPNVEGAVRAARSVLPRPFDGRELGSWLPRLRRPLKELVVFGGMQVDVTEIGHLQKSWTSWTSFKVTARLLARYGADRLLHRQGTRLIRGNALAARLLKSALDLKITLWSETVARRLVADGGRVGGLVVERKGEELTLTARRAVVLATGGFSANADWRQRHIPYPDRHISFLPEGNVGDGLRLAQEIGAALGPDNASNGIWTPASRLRRADGGITKYPHISFDRCKPGAIIVDRSGRRFVNEGGPYQVVVNAIQQNGTVPCYLIGDHAFLRKYGMGLARPAPYPYKRLVRAGYLHQAPTLEALAGALGLDAAGLVRTVGAANDYARTGVDLEFGRGGDIYSRSLGDAAHRPNPCLGPIATAPFYAVEIFPGDLGTTLGLRVNASAQVLGGDGAPIAGLYACGLDMNSVMRGFYPSAGSMHGPNMTFGYVAGCHIAGAEAGRLAAQ